MPPKTIVSLKDLHLTTNLTEGAEIVIPSDPVWSAAANRLQAVLRAHTGKTLPLISGDTASLSALNKRHLVLLGSAMNNPAIMALYRRKYAFLDDYYPGSGGYVIRTVHNPEGRGHNALLIGVSRPEETGAALGCLETLLEKTHGRLGYTNRSHSMVYKKLLPDLKPEEFRSWVKSMFAENLGFYPIDQGITLGFYHHLTGDPKFARMFREALFYYEELVHQHNDTWCFEHMLFIYAWAWRLAWVWDLIEESDAFTNAERLRVTRILWGITQYVADLTYFKGDRPPLPEVRQNHWTFAGLSGFFCTTYFSSYYEIQDFNKHHLFCEAIFNGQANSYKSNDEGGGEEYCWYVPSHQIIYDLWQNNFRFLKNGSLRQIADYTIQVTDNLGAPVSFGDVWGYADPGRKNYEVALRYERPSPDMKAILCAAAWYYQDGSYLWALDWMGGTPVPGSYYQTISGQAPDRLTGISIAPFNRPLYEWVERYANANVPFEDTFDKLVLRAGFNPEDEFLFLDGNATFAHGHEDGNSIERLTWKGRMWLAETDYIWKRPRHHCSVVSICNGESGPMPALTALKWAEDFGNTAFTRTTISDYNGVHWTRDLLWLKGHFFLVTDSMEFLHDADYDLRCLWRTLGTIESKTNDLTVEQQGVFFRICNADDSDKTVDDELPRVADKDPYEDYPFASGPIHIFKQQKTLRGEVGSTERYFNLLLAGTHEDTNAYRIERIAENMVRINGPDGPTLFGVSSARIGNFRIQAGTFALTETSLTLLGATALQVDEISLEANRPVHLVAYPTSGKGELRIAVETTVRVRNLPGLCINGKPFSESESLSPGMYELRFNPRPTDKLANALRSGAPYTHKRSPRKNRFVPTKSCAFRESWHTLLESSVTCLDVHNEHIAAGTAAGRVAFLNTNGQTLWTYGTGAKIRTVHLGETSFFAGGEDCALTCLNAGGAVQWTHNFIPSHGREQHLNAVTTNTQGHILAATDGWLVWAFTPEGEEIWQRQIEHHAAKSLIVADVDSDGKQEILVGTEYYHANLLESDGGIRWRTRGGPGYTALALADINGDDVLESFCGSMDGNVYAVHSITGDILWSVNLGDNVRHGLPLAEGFLAGSESGNLAFLCANGQPLWRKDLNAPVSGLTFLGDTIVAATADGWIYLLSHTGEPLGNHRLESGITALNVLPDGSGLLAGTESGQAIALTRT